MYVSLCIRYSLKVFRYLLSSSYFKGYKDYSYSRFTESEILEEINKVIHEAGAVFRSPILCDIDLFAVQQENVI